MVPTAVPGPAVTATGPGPVQGRPVNEFLPNGVPSIVRLGAGETGLGGPLAHSISAQPRIGGISAQQRIASVLRERNRNGCRQTQDA